MKLNKICFVFTVLNFIGVVTLGYVNFHSSALVYVNSSVLINKYRGMQDARKAYQKKAVLWQANIDTLSSEVQERIMSHEKESRKMTSKERELSLELIHAKQKQLAEYQQAMTAQAQQEDKKMTGEVIAQINSYIKRYGQQKGYTIVMAATEYGNIAYADEGLDITDDVLKGLNEEYSGQ